MIVAHRFRGPVLSPAATHFAGRVLQPRVCAIAIPLHEGARLSEIHSHPTTRRSLGRCCAGRSGGQALR